MRPAHRGVISYYFSLVWRWLFGYVPAKCERAWKCSHTANEMCERTLCTECCAECCRPECTARRGHPISITVGEPAMRLVTHKSDAK